MGCGNFRRLWRVYTIADSCDGTTQLKPNVDRSPQTGGAVPIALWVEGGVIACYAAGAVFVRSRLRTRAARWVFWGIGALLAALVLLQIAALIYLRFNPIQIDLGPW